MSERIVKPFSALWIGIAAISFGSIFIRLADAPAPVVAALRMAFASILLLPLCGASPAARSAIGRLRRHEIGLLVTAGALLALHFILWTASLSFTTIASSVIFVTTNPLWVALFTAGALRRAVPGRVWIGLAAAVAGGIVLGGGDLRMGGERWKGDLLALGGAMAAAGYFLAGSTLRRKLSTLAYVCPVYGTAAVLLAAAALAAGDPLAGLGWRTYVYCFLMALVCQVIGHSLFNWALAHLEATIVSLAVIGEPVGASVLAFVIFGENPGAAAIAGGACILAGIIIALSSGGRNDAGGGGGVSGG